MLIFFIFSEMKKGTHWSILAKMYFFYKYPKIADLIVELSTFEFGRVNIHLKLIYISLKKMMMIYFHNFRYHFNKLKNTHPIGRQFSLAPAEGCSIYSNLIYCSWLTWSKKCILVSMLFIRFSGLKMSGFQVFNSFYYQTLSSGYIYIFLNISYLVYQSSILSSHF